MHPEIAMNLLNVVIMANVLLYHSVQSLFEQRPLTIILARTGYAIKGPGIFCLVMGRGRTNTSATEESV